MGGGAGAGDVVLRFQEQGAAAAAQATDKVTESAKRMEAAWASAARAAAPLKTQVEQVSVAAVQQASQLNRSNGAVTASAEGATRGLDKLGGGARITGRVIAGFAGSMAGEAVPALGKFTSSLGSAAATAIAIGGAVGIAIAAVQLLTQMVADWVQKSKEAEEFQLRLTRALKGQDLGFVAGELEKLQLEMSKFGGQTDENRQKLLELQGVFKTVFAQTESQKLAREAQVAQLSVTKQQVQFEMEHAKTAEQVTEALQKQQTVAKQLADIEAKRIEAEAAPQAKKMRDTGFAKEAAEIEAAAKIRANAVRAGVQLEAQVLDEGAKARLDALRAEGVQRTQLQKDIETAILGEIAKVQDQQTQVMKTSGEMRLAIAQAQAQRESAVLDLSNKDSGTKIRERADFEVRNAEEQRDMRTQMIDKEVSTLKNRADMFKDNAEVQREIEGKILDLQGQRVQAEVAADGQIVAARKAMVEQLRQEADREAGLGESLTGKAIAKLKQRGKTKISEQDITEEVNKARERGAGAFGGLRTGGRVKIEDLEEAMGGRGMFADMAAMGTTAGQAVSQMGARGAAGFAGQRWKPTTFAGAPIPELGETIGGAPGMPGVKEAPQLDALFDDMKTKGNKTIDEMLQRVPGVMTDFFTKFTDDLIRKLEQEAART